MQEDALFTKHENIQIIKKNLLLQPLQGHPFRLIT